MKKKDQSTCQNSDFVNKKGEVQYVHIKLVIVKTFFKVNIELYVQPNLKKVLTIEKDN